MSLFRQTLSSDSLKVPHLVNLIRFAIVRTLEYWIGANDVVTEGEFRWADYSPVTWSIMENRQPNGGTDQNCVLQVQWTGNTWHDGKCAKSYRSVCQRKAGIEHLRHTIGHPSGDELGLILLWDLEMKLTQTKIPLILYWSQIAIHHRLKVCVVYGRLNIIFHSNCCDALAQIVP